MLIIIIFIVILVFCILIIDTNSVVNNVKKIMNGNVDEAITNDTPLSRYNMSNIIIASPNANVECKITRLFVLHNFFDGYIWVRYYYKITSSDADILTASGPLISLWKIHKAEGKWEVTEIIESP